MNGVESFLTKKVGPLPMWVYAAAGGILVSVFFLYKKGASAPAASTDSSSGTGTPIYVTPPANPSPAGTTSTPSAGSHSVVTGNLGAQSVWLHASPSKESPVVAFLAQGQSLPAGGAMVTGGAYTSDVQPGISGNHWLPIKYGTDTVYAFAPEVSVQESGMGGGSHPVRTFPGAGTVHRFSHASDYASGRGGAVAADRNMFARFLR
jgi:hypothetical protein